MAINMKNLGTEFVPKIADEERKEKRKRKWELIAGAVGDGMSAVSNLIFASLGAPMSVSTTTGKGKNTNRSLIEVIKGKHSGQDANYGNKLTAWEKEEEKKRKEAESNAREKIHPDFQPLKRNWNDKDFLSLMYEDLLNEIAHKNKRDGKNTSSLFEHLEGQKVWTEKEALPYIKQSILYSVLDGTLDDFDDEHKSELNEDFLNMFRKKWSENQEYWNKIK